MLEKIVFTAAKIKGSLNKLYDTKAAGMFNDGGFMDSVLITLGIGVDASLMYDYIKTSINFIRDAASQVSKFY